jgi:hypothetical protein
MCKKTGDDADQRKPWQIEGLENKLLPKLPG